ncbi:hypothetical protein V8E54_013597 [Elaphomyces granulatus]
MKLITFFCTFLLATSTGFATPSAAPAAEIISAKSPALDERQLGNIMNVVNICPTIDALQNVTTAVATLVTNSTQAAPLLKAVITALNTTLADLLQIVPNLSGGLNGARPPPGVSFFVKHKRAEFFNS